MFRLFPRATHPFAQALGRTTYRSLVKLKLLKKVEQVVLPTLHDQETFELDLDREAERKRCVFHDSCCILGGARLKLIG